VKAILHTNYEVLIKIHATTVTTTDCNLRNMTFLPKLLYLPTRLQFGFFQPNTPILGTDLSGEIEAVGKDVTRFKIGDPVFGTPEPAFGAHAQYVSMPEDGVLSLKPSNISYEEAASVTLAWHTAVYFIKDQGNIQAGQKVLINGASGAIGTFALQLAKYYGAEVTGVCSTTNLELVKSLGADKVIDYTQEDFTSGDETYDVIFDVVHKSSFMRCRRALRENGLYLVTMPGLPFLLQTIWTSIASDKTIKNGSRHATVEDLLLFKDLAEAGKVKTVIDRRYPLEQTAEAFRYVEGGHKKGNVVITVDHN
jgi:NADPH:quinone reductase-like Zn-dependent oxidoreductase